MRILLIILLFSSSISPPDMTADTRVIIFVQCMVGIILALK